MSLFGNILSKIIPSAKAETAPAKTAEKTEPATDAGGAGGAVPGGTAPGGEAPKESATPAATALPAAAPKVDVAAVLDAAAAKSKERLDWQHSIVDLLKIINEDSSLASRQQLAKELHYTGDQADSATMNTWLHKEVMQKLAEHGGTLPEGLRR